MLVQDPTRFVCIRLDENGWELKTFKIPICLNRLIGYEKEEKGMMKVGRETSAPRTQA